MKPLPHTKELLSIAERVNWFATPEDGLGDPIRFMAYLMTYGTAAEIEVVRRHVGAEDFCDVLESAPPGIFDERSWAYWNVMAGRYPVPPMPRRALLGVGEEMLVLSLRTNKSRGY
ncbi:MAG: hypothetical protein ACKVQA_09915 [Burkholderiales bacterium]